jgi:membrane fusion protein (multidrug efflux system)
MKEGPISAPRPAQEAAEGGSLAKLNRAKFLVPAGLILAALLYAGVDYLSIFLSHESTDDAFIAGHIVSIAPRVAGQVAAVLVADNQMVRSNDLIVELDPADYEMTHSQKAASAEAQSANYRTVLAALQLMEAKLDTARATARESQADADASSATATRAQADYVRAQELRKQNTISEQEYDSAEATTRQAAANFSSARQKADADASKVKEAEAQLEAAKSAVGMALAQSRSAQKDAQGAQLHLSYTKIFAPCAGRVTRKAVEAGDYLQVGQQIMSLVPEEVWVSANFKESQLEKMVRGQAATVEIDALGGRTFRAHLDSIQAGSGAQFSLLPPENATGNFVKVVQRVPVKLIFDEPLPANKIIGPGLSVTASVQVRSFALPVWAIALITVVLDAAAILGFRGLARREGRSA